MEFKTETFFKNNELDVKTTASLIMQHPNQSEEILNFISCKIRHFAEFDIKMEMLKEKYDQDMMELYAKYMKDEKHNTD